MRTHRVLRATAVAAMLAASAPAAASAASQDLRSPDARDFATRAVFQQAPTDLRSPDARDAAIGRGTADAPNVVVVGVPHVVTRGNGIDWADAGVGAGGTLALVVVAGAAAVAIGRRRSSLVHLRG